MTVESPITPELKMIKRRPLIEENLERPHPQLSRGRRSKPRRNLDERKQLKADV